MIEWTLEAPQYWRPFPWSTMKVRITNDARGGVVFLGDCDVDGDPSSFRPFATGFLIGQRGVERGSCYLVTAKHSLECPENPIWVRMNTKEGAVAILVEEPDWTFHPDNTVDLAVMEFHPPAEAVYTAWYNNPVTTYGRNSEAYSGFGPGDLTYTVGLFDSHSGANRNIPLVHTGNIAAFSDGEKIAVHDWDTPKDSGETKLIEAYIIQCSTLPGSSGSPVFARKAVDAIDYEHMHDKKGKAVPPFPGFKKDYPKAYGPVHLLGVWRGSWELLEKDIRGRTTVRYPAGYGMAVPGIKLLEVLGMPKLTERLEKAKKLADEKRKQKAIPVADSLPRRQPSKAVFDKTLKRMLDTPPDPRVKNK